MRRRPARRRRWRAGTPRRMLAGGERLLAHAAFPDHDADVVVADHLVLVRLLARRRRRARGLADPLIAFLHHHRTAVIDDLTLEVDRRLRAGVDAMVDGVAAGVETAGDRN